MDVLLVQTQSRVGHCTALCRLWSGFEMLDRALLPLAGITDRIPLRSTGSVLMYDGARTDEGKDRSGTG